MSSDLLFFRKVYGMSVIVADFRLLRFTDADDADDDPV